MHNNLYVENKPCYNLTKNKKKKVAIYKCFVGNIYSVYNIINYIISQYDLLNFSSSGYELNTFVTIKIHNLKK